MASYTSRSRPPAARRPERRLGDPHMGSLGGRFTATFTALRRQVADAALKRAAAELGVDLAACTAGEFHALSQLAAEAR